MSISSTGERQEIRRLARELARRELSARAHALDAGELEAREHCRQVLAQAGMNRALLTESDGGAGMDVPALLGALQELAGGDAGVALEVLLSNAALGLLDGTELKEVGEQARWSVVPAISEREAWIQDGVLHGRVEGALGAAEADGLILLFDSADPQAWVVSVAQPGVQLQIDELQMGLRAAPAAAIVLDGAQGRPAGANLDERSWAECLVQARALLSAGTAAIAQGIAQRAYELAWAYAHERRQGGVAIIEHEAVSDMLAAMLVRLSSLGGQAQFDHDEGDRLDPQASIARRIAATDAAVAATTDAVQVFGGTGYMVETGIEKLMRDAKYCQLFPMSNWLAASELVAAERALHGSLIAG